MNVDVLSLPIGRHSECAAIRAHVIALVLYSRWVHHPIATPCILIVHIDGIAVAVQLPNARHRHGAPLGVIVLHSIEVGRALVGTLHPVELPLAFDAHITL